MKKIFFIIISLSLFLFNKSFAATGEATEYTITMTHLEIKKVLDEYENDIENSS